MQELEKTLEELKRIKDGNRKEKLYAKYPPNSKDQEVLNAYSQGYEDGTDNFYNAAAEIIRNHMNDGWIPVEERLPENGHCVLVCGMEGWIDAGWYVRGIWRTGFSAADIVKNIVAWQPLPKPYRPKRSEGE